MERPAGDVQIWDKWNSTYRIGRLDQPSKVRLREILAMMAHLKIQGARILEVGCGTGWLSDKLSEFGKVTACDLGSKIIDLAQTTYPQVDFRSGDIHTLDLEANSFDVIVTSEVLSHVADQPLYAQAGRAPEARRFPAPDFPKQIRFRARRGISPPDGWIRRWVTMKMLKNLLREDFRIRSATTLEPEGHIGILRLVNSARLNYYCSAAFGAERVKRSRKKPVSASRFLLWPLRR